MDEVMQNVEIEETDYTEEGNNKYSMLSNKSSRHAIAVGMAIFGIVGTLTYKQRKKIKNHCRKVRIHNLKNRKNHLEKELFEVTTTLEKYENRGDKKE